jgi:hypothetical protein
MQYEIKSNGKVILEADESMPKSVLKSLLNLQDSIEEVTNAVKKKMTKANATSFTKMKSNFNKWLTNEENVIEEKMTFGLQLAKYKENPEESEDEDDDSDDDDDDDDSEGEAEVEKKAEASEEECEYEYEDEEEPEEENEEKKEAKAKEQEKKVAAQEYDAEEDEEYGEEYEDEEDSDSEVEADAEELENDEEMDETLRKKYNFLRKAREDMTPSEKRWKWVLKDCLPLDMLKYIALGQTKKKKKDKDEKKDGKVENEGVETTGAAADDDKGPGFIVDNKLELDYKIVKNVEETLEVLKAERLKGKFNPIYHAKVLNLVVDQFNNPQSLSEKRLQINVTFYLIGTLFLTIKSDLGFFEREQWIDTHKRLDQLITMVHDAEFRKSLLAAHETSQVTAGKEGEAMDLDALESKEAEQRAMLETERSVFPTLSNLCERLDE